MKINSISLFQKLSFKFLRVQPPNTAVSGFCFWDFLETSSGIIEGFLGKLQGTSGCLTAAGKKIPVGSCDFYQPPAAPKELSAALNQRVLELVPQEGWALMLQVLGRAFCKCWAANRFSSMQKCAQKRVRNDAEGYISVLSDGGVPQGMVPNWDKYT